MITANPSNQNSIPINNHHNRHSNYTIQNINKLENIK